MSNQSDQLPLVIGVSGSPIRNSNTDRAVRAALEATGCRTEFIKLSDYRVEPCRACLGCVRTSRCVISDDGVTLAEKVREADALLVGGYTPYSSLDARTKAFLERLYPLRHQKGLMRGKPGGAIITYACPEGAEGLPPAAEIGTNSVVFYMMEEGMQFVGAARYQGNVPCISCGFGDECEMSGIKMLFGPDASVAGVGVNCVSENAVAMDAARDLGRRIGEAARAR